MEINSEKTQRVVSLLRNARSALFITGAGISADSGLPTYRGIGGLYNHDSTDDGIPIETALSGEMMAANPAITWKYIYQIEHCCRGASFNRGHQVIAEMEKAFNRVWVLTQNIDGFHHQAGSKNVIDIHGNIHDLKCTHCTYTSSVRDYSGLHIPPRCPKCSSVIRPDVVLFGELLPQDKYQLLKSQLDIGFDIVFSIGTTSVFPYISEPVFLARNQGKPAVEINPGITQVSKMVDIKIEAGAAQALDTIWTLFNSN
jgi:NAD-dependent deacetylase